jgi:type II secretory pathway pseudopilin PulG
VSDNTNSQSGLTIVELVISLVVAGILITTLLTVTFFFYGSTLRNSNEARLAVESQNILRSIAEELRVSSGIRTTSLPDANATGGQWTTSDTNLVLIIASPAFDSSNEFISDPSGGVYNNEIVYFAQGSKLYKRFLTPSGATGNRTKTSCPAATSSATCPEDVLLTEHFKALSFKFYNQDNSLIVSPTPITNARSVEFKIDMQEKAFGSIVTYNNKIRMTMRNNQL